MHHLQAFVLAPPEHRSALALLSRASVRPLAGGLSLVPLTNELHDDLLARFPGGSAPTYPTFEKLSHSGEQLARALSMEGLVAYMETEYFGGPGEQAAAVWSHGELIISPARNDFGAINAALRALGVTRTEAQDEFDVVGLGRFRSTESWASEAARPG